MNQHELRFKEATGQDFQSFYRKYRPKLVYWLTHYTRDVDRAEDLASDAFIQGLEKIHTYDREKSQIHTWVYKIGENIAKKEWKERQRLRAISIDQTDDDEVSVLGTIEHDDGRKDLEEEAVINAKAMVARDAIHGLPEKYRDVLVMRELEGKAYLDIAKLSVKDEPIAVDGGTRTIEGLSDFLSLELEGSDADATVKVMAAPPDGMEFVLTSGEVHGDEAFYADRYGEAFGPVRAGAAKITRVLVESRGGSLNGVCRRTTNLSTIKSQISKGRQLVIRKVERSFREIDEKDILGHP